MICHEHFCKEGIILKQDPPARSLNTGTWHNPAWLQFPCVFFQLYHVALFIKNIIYKATCSPTGNDLQYDWFLKSEMQVHGRVFLQVSGWVGEQRDTLQLGHPCPVFDKLRPPELIHWRRDHERNKTSIYPSSVTLNMTRLSFYTPLFKNWFRGLCVFPPCTLL